MIEKYTIKFGQAVSQKELEKALHESGYTVQPRLHKMKARIEILVDFADIQKRHNILKELSNQ